MRIEGKAISALIASLTTIGSDAFTVISPGAHRHLSTSTSGQNRNAILSFSNNRHCVKPFTASASASSLLKATDDDMEYDDDDEDDDDDEQEYDPLGKGVDSISWLPPLDSASDSSSPTSVKEGSEILPFFPLGGIVYTPNSEHVLNIFEPRYRQMYTDILMNGSKRFVVAMSHPEKPGTFAETGVIFYLDDLKEVSEETGDQIKYICNHRVTKRVKLQKILNPDAWQSRETYLKVEANILDEDDDDDEEPDVVTMDENIQNSDVYKQLVASISSAKPNESFEEELKKSFEELVHIQHDVEEDVRFTRASIPTLAVRAGNSEDGLWMTIRLWQSFIEQRLVARQNEMQMEFQEKLLDFLKKEKGLEENELPSAIGYNDLSPALQDEVQELQKRMAVELQPLVLESTLAIQKILEADGHEARCNLLKHFMDAEKKRLEAKKQLQSMFGGISIDDKDVKAMLEEIDFEEEDDDDDDSNNDDGSSPSTGSLFVDEPDAFQ
mmetsp:Transcript_8997/g.13620  ORF Transcript_8997/g.13620 Transcript_8997/m.13620 type:complete len:497 (+) Transcript_8997:117-1607(+)